MINVHGNNNGHYLIIENIPLPDALEVTFINKAFYADVEKEYPEFLSVGFENLNKPCNPNLPEILLPNFLHINSISKDTNSIGFFCTRVI